MAITDTKLKKILNKPQEKVHLIADGHGLSAKVYTNGTIVWVFRYRHKGKSKTMPIGRYPLELSIKEARAELVRLKDLVDQGIDPALEKKESVKKNEDAITINECFDLYLKSKTLADETKKNYLSVIKRFEREKWPPVDRIKLHTYYDYFENFESKKNAKAHFKKFKAVLRWAYKRKLINRPEIMEIDTKDIGDKPDVGERVCSLTEMTTFIKLLQIDSGVMLTKLTSLWIVLVGCRRKEAIELDWHDLDFHENVWIMPAEKSKTRKIVRRPITKHMKAILDTVAFHTDREGPVFKRENGDRVGGTTINDLFDRVLDEMTKHLGHVSRFTPHDMRRTVTTNLSNHGVMPHVTEKMLGHVLGGVFAVYNKHDWLEEQAQAYDTWADLIKLSVDSYALLQHAP